MIDNNKKVIIFKEDAPVDLKKELCYVKFLDKEQKYAVFYKPLIAPKYFRHYLEENKIKEAYILNSDEKICEYIDKLYTFESEYGVYICKKGISETKKYVLMVDSGMEIELDAEKYSYEIKNDSILIKPYKAIKNKGYCYVFDEENVNPYLKAIMIETSELIPGILYMGTYDLDSNVKKKKL